MCSTAIPSMENWFSYALLGKTIPQHEVAYKYTTILLLFIISVDQEFWSNFLDGSGLHSLILKKCISYISAKNVVTWGFYWGWWTLFQGDVITGLSMWCWLGGEASVYHCMDLLMGWHECLVALQFWEAILQGLSHLMSKGTENFLCSPLSFPGCLCSKQPW